MKKNKFNYIFKYVILLICLFISAINFNLLIKPLNFVTGGTPGFSIIMEYIFEVPVNYSIYLIYIISFILSYFILGKKSIIDALIATIFYPLFITLTSDIIKYIIIDYNDFFLMCLFSGIINGLCNGFIYKFGFPSSGLGVLGPICNKCFNYSIAKTNFVVNMIIVLIGGYFFGIEMVLYAIIFLYLSGYISNKIIIGISKNKVIILRSQKINEINECLYKNYDLEPINLKVKGGFSNKEGLMTLIVLPTERYNKIIGKIKEIDKNVFYNVLDGYEIKNYRKNKVVVQ